MLKTPDKCPKCEAKPSWWDQYVVAYECESKRIYGTEYLMQTDKCKINVLKAKLKFVEAKLKSTENALLKLCKERDLSEQKPEMEAIKDE
jgi:hypothetical protein